MLRLFMSALQVHAAEGNGKPFRPRQALLVRLAIGCGIILKGWFGLSTATFFSRQRPGDSW